MKMTQVYKDFYGNDIGEGFYRVNASSPNGDPYLKVIHISPEESTFKAESILDIDPIELTPDHASKLRKIIDPVEFVGILRVQAEFMERRLAEPRESTQGYGTTIEKKFSKVV